MSVNSFVIMVCVLSLIVGAFIGIKIFKAYSKKQDKKLLEDAEQVLSGKKDNKIKIDGQEYDATKFRVRDEDDKDIIIDLQGGGTVQNGRQRTEEISEQEVETPGETSESNGENGCSGRKKKRNTRVRRIRRFG